MIHYKQSSMSTALRGGKDHMSGHSSGDHGHSGLNPIIGKVIVYTTLAMLFFWIIWPLFVAGFCTSTGFACESSVRIQDRFSNGRAFGNWGGTSPSYSSPSSQKLVESKSSLCPPSQPKNVYFTCTPPGTTESRDDCMCK